MKRIAGALFVLLTAIALTASGCAATQVEAEPAATQVEAEPAATQVETKPATRGTTRSAAAYVHAVNQQAQRRGAHVMWVNPPQDR